MFIDEEFKQVDEALEYAKIQGLNPIWFYETRESIYRNGNGRICKTWMVLNKEIVYIDLEEQKTIINKPKQIVND